MRLVISFLFASILWGMSSGPAIASWPWANKPLLTIDGEAYTPEDFEHWWQEWRESETQQPEGITPFVEWLLQLREAERMDLASLPEYRHKVEVFLKTRALMALKQEEINTKVSISEEALKAVYERDYAPRHLLGVLEFSSLAEAQAFQSQGGGAPLSQERLQAMADKKSPPVTLRRPQWFRPLNTPPPWRPLLGQAVPRALVGPLPQADKKAILLYLLEVKAADPLDFAEKRETIKEGLRKIEENRLTERLVSGLKTKYRVRIDDEVLQAIDLANPGGNDLHKVVIDSDRSKVTVGYFVEQVRKQSDLSRRPLGDRDSQMRLKQQIANAMISNSLVSWEALDRHYEERPPLQWTYRFYRQNRMVVELERRAVGDLKTSESEVQAYYEGHLEEFRHKEMVRAVVVNGDEGAVRKVWAEAIAGADLEKAAQGGKLTLALASSAAVPTPHLSASARQALATLKEGELSQPFAEDGHFAVIKLVERKPGGVLPLAQAQKMVTDKLMAEKRATRRRQLIDTLKSRSTVTVHEEVWAELVKKIKNYELRIKNDEVNKPSNS